MSTVADGVDVLSEPWFLSVPVVAVKLLKLLFFFFFFLIIPEDFLQIHLNTTVNSEFC